MNRKRKSIDVLIILIGIMIICTGCTDSTELQNEYDLLLEEYQSLQELNDSLTIMKEELETENNELLLENEALEVKVEEAAPWFEMTEIEQQKQEEELAAELAAQEEAEAEAQAQAEAEAEEKEKIGYETGITYDQLARTPDTYIGEKVKFSGNVLQVTESDEITVLRVATSGNYDDVVLVYYLSSIVESRVLEDDDIIFYGVSDGLYTYTSTGSGEITIPSVIAEMVE